MLDHQTTTRSLTSKGPSRRTHRRLAYLCLQATREGQASHAHVHEIIAGLREFGWEVELFEPSYAGSGKIPGPLGRLLEFMRVQRKLRKRKDEFDLLYFRSHYPNFPSARWARKVGIPVVQEINSSFEDLFVAWPSTRPFGFIFKWLLRTQLRWAQAIITVTPQLRDWVCTQVNHPLIEVVSNAANTKLFHPTAKTSEVPNQPYVIFFGSFAAWQGIETLLAAVDEKDWPSEVKAVFVGDGVLCEKVARAAEHHNLVEYLGTKPYTEVPGLISASLAGLCPKNNKGLRTESGLSPLKLYETLACGVPVVVSEFPGQADLVRQHRCGLVIPPEDPAALARAIEYLFHNPDEQKEMGTRGRKAVEEDHSWTQRAKQTAKILEGLL